MALTLKEKRKIAKLRRDFTDEEWDLLSSSDAYARERIAFYSLRKLAGLKEIRQSLQRQKETTTTQIETYTNDINILEE